MSNSATHAAVYAAQVRARRAEARADFFEQRADVFDHLGERFDDENLAIWDAQTPTTKGAT